MPSTLYNVQLWLDHAEEVRALSRAINDPQTKQLMMSVAAGFDRIAGLATNLRSKSNSNTQSRRLAQGSIADLLREIGA